MLFLTIYNSYAGLVGQMITVRGPYLAGGQGLAERWSTLISNVVRHTTSVTYH